jgi:hypothetical protein
MLHPSDLSSETVFPVETGRGHVTFAVGRCTLITIRQAALGQPAETTRQSLATALGSPDGAIGEIHGVLSAAVQSPECA